MKNVLKNACFLLFPLFFATCFSGCKAPHQAEPTVGGMLPQAQWRATLAKQNTEALEKYKEERIFNRTNQKAGPQIGLALSGGGIRSAMFSIGVMKGLQDIQEFSNVDVLSSVSGGGYAASWLYLQSIQNGYKLDEMFDNAKRYQIYLTKHGELVSHAAASHPWFRWPEYGVNAVEVVLSQPVNAFANGLFGWRANVSPMRRIYEDGIDRVFHVTPTEAGKHTALDLSSWSYDLSLGLNPPRTVSIESLGRKIKGSLPFPIVNATAHIEDASPVDASLLKNQVFEFTPLHYGNDYFGYRFNDFPMTYNRMIEVSGAAVDSKKVREPNVRLAASAFNFDLGYSIDNPNISSGQRFFRNLLPLPLYLFAGHYQRDYNGDSISLADGGHCENLGAYSLVRRLCDHIIIVDAEYDPDYTFEGYRILKQALRSEMGVDLQVGQIDDFLAGKAGRSFTGKKPVMSGTISSFPILIKHHVTDIDLKVVYIKMSLNRAKLNPGVKGAYPPVIIDFANEHDDFPQRTTEDQSFTPDQVASYRELGYYIVKHNEARLHKLLH